MCPGASDEIGQSIKSMQAAFSFTISPTESKEVDGWMVVVWCGGVEIWGGLEKKWVKKL